MSGAAVAPLPGGAAAFAVVPVVDEAAAIAGLVGDLLDAGLAGVVVVDGGSRDDTVRLAGDAGAAVVVEPRRGYGRAMFAGVAAARRAGAELLVFLDGNGSVGAGQALEVLAPVAGGAADLAVGCRPADRLRLMQRAGNRLAVEVIARSHGVRYADIGSVRAIAAAALDDLGLDQAGYGWPLQLHIRAAARGLRIHQVPIALAPRRSRSKVSGTLRGRLGASAVFVRLLATECAPWR